MSFTPISIEADSMHSTPPLNSSATNVVPLRRKPEEAVSADHQEPRGERGAERSAIIALSVE
jgi:hypothetical protein